MTFGDGVIFRSKKRSETLQSRGCEKIFYQTCKKRSVRSGRRFVSFSSTPENPSIEEKNTVKVTDLDIFN
jgi:hypothetical protein